MEEKLIKHLTNTARRYGIQIVFIEENSDDPDVAIHSQMLIIMNTNYNSSFPESFRLAHELAHLLYSEPTFAYTFSPYFQNKEERLAHEGAIKLIVDYIYEDVPLEYRNWTEFMEQFNLPIWFEFAVRDAIYD